MRRWCMLAPLLVVMAAVPAAQPTADDLPDRYARAVDAYRRGDFETAAALADWPEPLLKRAAAIRGDARETEAAAMLHTDLVIHERVTGDKAILVHMALAESLVRRLPAASTVDGRTTPTFQQSWYELAASLYLAMTDPELAGDLLNRGLRVVRPNAPLRTLSGAVEEMRAHIADGNLHDPVVINAMPMTPARRRIMLAEREYRAALAIDPDYGLARLRLGRVLALRQEHKPAREALDRVATRESDQSLRYLAHLFLGGIAEAEHDYDAARRAYTAAAEVIPGAQSAIVALSFAEAMLGQEARARRLLAGFSMAADVSVDDPWSAYQNGGLSTFALNRLHQEITR